MADELDGTATLVMIDRKIAELENALHERLREHDRDHDYKSAQWRRFELEVAPMRRERELIVTAMARIKAFETPPPIIIVSHPERSQ